ncbi:MAG: hypothetical protein ACPGN3_07660 [Opitutales bacterium]
MRSFKFKLESIKKIRESEEKHALDEYAKAMQRRHSQELRIEKLEQDLRDAEGEIVARRKRTLCAGDLHADRNATMAIRLQLESTRKELEAALQEEDASRDVFLEAKSNREILVRLEDKHKLDFEKEERRKEEIEIEDIVVSRHGRMNEGTLV